MPKFIERRYLFPLLAGLLLAALALWQWAGELGPAASPLAPARGVTTIDWDDDQLALDGRAEANAAITLQLGDAKHETKTSDVGTFEFNITATPAPLTRAELKIGEDVYGLLFVRIQGRWAALQRALSGPVAAGPNARAWVPVAGVHDKAPLIAGVLSLTKDNGGYVAALSLPANHTTYVYSNSRLVAVINRDNATGAALAPLPETTAQLRLDIYDGRTLAQRLRLTVPPGDGVLRWGLNDSTVWLPTDLSAQKGEVDEMLPGQFIPPGPEETADISTTAAEAPRHTDAPAVQTAPAR